MTTKSEPSPTRPGARRPFSVTLLALGVLIIAGLHLARLLQTLQQWDFLAGLPGVPPLYLALTGLMWALVGFPLGFAILWGAPPALNATRLAVAVYIIYFWFTRLLAAYRSGTWATGFAWVFALGSTIVLLVIIYWILSRPKVKAYFRRD